MKKKLVEKKKKINSTFEILNFITRKSKFKITIILSILLTFYGSFVLSAGIKNYFTAALCTFQFGTFNALFFLILFINTINVCSTFDKYDFYIIRLNNKKKYLNELIKIVTYSNIIVIGVIILSYFAMLNLVEFQYIFPSVYNGYVNNIVYTFFYLVRYSIIAISISILSILSYVKIGEKKTIIINIIFVAFFWFFSGYNEAIVNSFSFLPWDYFKSIKYGSFSLEINYSLWFILMLEIIIYLLCKMVNIKYSKANHYMVLNDLEYLLREKYKEIVLLIIIPFLVLVIVNLELNSNGLEILKMTFGLNIKEENLNIINIVMFAFNLIIQLYLVLCLYAKDLKRGLDNLFLRISSTKWYLIKESLTLIITALLKIIQYLLVVGIIFIAGKSNLAFSKIYGIFLSDFLFTITIQQIFILSYLNIKTLPKIIRYILILIIVLFAIVIPKNIMWYNRYQIVLLIINFIIILISILIYRFNKRRVVQTMGGI